MIFRATSRPVRSSRASQTDPLPPLPSGRSGRYRSRTSPAPSSASAAFDTVLNSFAPEGLFPSWPKPGVQSTPQMSSYDDEPIEFDFFDEPDTVEATQRRRLPRLEMPGGRGGGDRPPKPPMRPPTGLVPLARLVGLIAIAIAVVLGLVFWVDSCQGKSKQDEYAAYAEKVKAIAAVDKGTAKEFSTTLLQPGLKQTDLVDKLQSYANQEQQAFTQAQQI